MEKRLSQNSTDLSNQRSRSNRKKGSVQFGQRVKIKSTKSKNGPIVLDPLSGCGTTILQRKNPYPSKVNILPLKMFGSELHDGPLKTVLLSEISDEMDVNTLLARIPIWLALARMKKM